MERKAFAQACPRLSQNEIKQIVSNLRSSYKSPRPELHRILLLYDGCGVETHSTNATLLGLGQMEARCWHWHPAWRRPLSSKLPLLVSKAISFFRPPVRGPAPQPTPLVPSAALIPSYQVLPAVLVGIAALVAVCGTRILPGATGVLPWFFPALLPWL